MYAEGGWRKALTAHQTESSPFKKKTHGFVVQDLVLPCAFWLPSACVCVTVTRTRAPRPQDSCPFSHPTSCCQGRSGRIVAARRGGRGHLPGLLLAGMHHEVPRSPPPAVPVSFPLSSWQLQQ